MAVKSPTIDRLPTEQKQKVVDAILAGKSLRIIGKMAGISQVAALNYKNKVVLPAIKNARKIVEAEGVPDNPTKQVAKTAALTEALAIGSSIISRVQELAADRAEVKEKAKADGQLGAWASMDRNDLSALELEARLTGALDTRPSTVNVVVFSPMQPSVAPASGTVVASAASGPAEVIDAELLDEPETTEAE